MTTISSRRPLTILLSALGAGALLLGAAACSSGAGEDASSASDGSQASERTLTVFAAASLTDVYEGLNDEFEAQNPGVTVVMTNGGSSDLVTQISQGAPADVLATADAENMSSAQEQGLISGDPQIFATNELTIAVQPGNPHAISSLEDLANPDLAVVRCATGVPCGTVSDEVLADAGVTLTPVSEENSVTDVLGKVTAGEADAGLVYTTDVARSNGEAEGVVIANAGDHATEYPIAVTAEASDPDLAAAYTAFILSEDGQSALQEAGFGAP